MDILSEIKVSLQSLVKEHEISFNIESEQEQVKIISDESLIRKMIYNIAENAVRFTHSGGVRIKIENQLASQPNNFIIIHIIDSGIGIKKEDHQLIFKEFRQASEGYRRHYEGLGLGLNISKKIAEILKTQITLESEFGSGSTFTLRIPKQIGEIKTSTSTNYIPISSGSAVPKSISEMLVIEDNLINAEVLQWFLSKFGNVTTSMTGETALMLSKEKNYDLFLIDINLGKGMDGIELLNKLRNNPVYRNTPMVAVTGYASDANKKELIEKGFNHFLAKPVEKNEVVNLVKQIFNLE
jgi:CheY-like chemotaxis protein